MLALFAAGCTQAAPGKLEVNVGQVSDDDDGAGGEGGSTGAGGETTASGTTAASTTASTGSGVSQQATYTISFDTSAPEVDLDDAVEMMITVSPNGYEGSVSLTINNLGNGGIEGSSLRARSPSTAPPRWR